jgi:2-polyprenylphenol 6-hydroxylase
MGNSTHKNNDIIVFGAGLVGLSAAISLANLGMQVLLVDAKPRINQLIDAWDPRVYALTPATEHWLTSLDIWSAVDQKRVNNVEAMSLWHSDSESPLILSSQDANLSKLACIIENQNLMQALWQKIDALSIPTQMGVSCQNIHYVDDRVELTFDDNTKISANLLIAADGEHSFVRQQLDVATKLRDFKQTALVANYQLETSHGNVARQWFSSHETLALLPLPSQHVSMVWALSTELARELLNLSTENLALAVEEKSNRVLGKLKPITNTYTFALVQQTANKLIAERVVFLGDAAHKVHPMAGQGANLGFRDTIALQTLLASRHPLQDIGDNIFLRQYERVRKADVLNMNLLTSGLDRLFSIDSSWAKRLTSIAMLRLNSHPRIKNTLIKQAVA